MAQEKRGSERTWILGCGGVLVTSVVLCCVCAGGLAWLGPRYEQADRVEKVSELRADLERRTQAREDASVWRRLLQQLTDIARAGSLRARAFGTLWDEYKDAIRDGRLDEDEFGRLLEMLTELVSSGGTSTGFDEPSGGSSGHGFDWD